MRKIFVNLPVKDLDRSKRFFDEEARAADPCAFRRSATGSVATEPEPGGSGDAQIARSRYMRASPTHFVRPDSLSHERPEAQQPR